MGKGEEIPKTNPAEIEAVIARVKQSNIEQRDVELIERLSIVKTPSLFIFLHLQTPSVNS